MDSLKEYLSTCKVIDTESDLRKGNPTVLLQNGQPARVFDSTGQPQPFIVALIANPESLSQVDVVALAIIAEEPEWIIIVNYANQICGLIEPEYAEELQVAEIRVEHGELGGRITPLPSDEIIVSVSYYGCLKHPEAERIALHQSGQPIPRCPQCGEPMTKLKEIKRSRAR